MGNRLRSAAELLNPTLVAAGFAPAQYGGPPLEPSGVTYCAAFDSFAVCCPHLPRAASAEWRPGGCVDLVIQVDPDDRVNELHLESYDLVETCRAVGYTHESASVATIIGSDILDAVPELQRILQRLFGVGD